MKRKSATYSALHLRVPHAVELVVRLVRGGLRELADRVDDIANGFLGGFQDVGDCSDVSFQALVARHD